ncbi:YhfG family protein [Saccharophagus degradans]|uniref:YhfG family protein n=2 Tax=Saccharophagus degradans TaxID=86304 RepID=UPI0034DF16DB
MNISYHAKIKLVFGFNLVKKMRKASLEDKKAYARKSRSGNYRVSLKLEGFTSRDSSSVEAPSKAALIARYTKAEKT